MPVQSDSHSASPTLLQRRTDGGFFAYHGFWAPGVRLFRQLTFRAKASLISIAFLIPMAALAGIYLSQSRDALRTMTQARLGFEVAAEVVPLIHMLQEQRRTKLDAPSADATAGTAAAAVKAQMARVVAAIGRLGADSPALEPLKVLAANIDKAAGQASSRNLLAIHKRQTQSIDAAIALLDAVLDATGLSLNPNPDSALLVQAGQAQLPRLTESALASYDLVLAASRGADGATAARMLAPQRAMVLYLDAQVRQALDKVAALHPPIAPRIAYAPVQEAAARLDDLVAGIGEEGWKADSATVQAARRTMAERSAALQGALATEAQVLQGERERVLKLQVGSLLALLTAALAMAVYMFIAFARVMQGGLHEARRHLHAMTEGDLTTSPNPWGADEAAELMLDLRTMQNALREIVLQVRASSDDIVDASQRIAGGAQELSAHSDDTARMLQHSSTSLEQIGASVRQSADDAGQAAGLGRENADAATRGGQVVDRVNATMTAIHDSSSRIGEIITVIDGIAFQTNILALNAAVEAARAGEAGRGFAVVAAEVRSLAQRSASAAREIKTLVTGSIETVAQGVSVVQDASRTMTEIVTSAQRVTGLVNGIAQGVRDQAQGVTEIGTAVNQADSMTQRNVGLVEQTATAARGLEHQARVLAERVARFTLPTA